MEYYIINQEDFCKASNHYRIYPSDSSHRFNPEEDHVGDFEEEVRMCFSPLCQFRQFKLRCTLYGEDYTTAYRPVASCFQCFGCCPQKLVISKHKIRIGQIQVPTFFGCGKFNSCAGLSLHVIDGHDKHIYTIESKFCQMGNICCCLRCCVGQAIQYRIYDPSGTPIGRILNLHRGFWKQLLTKQDRFAIEFPRNIPTQHKKILINAPTFIDFLRYETFI